MQHNLLLRLLSLSFVMLLMLACSDSSQTSEDQRPTPAEYDLNNPQVIKLADRLNEISGLAYYPKDSSLFAIVDEVGVLYKILLRGEKPELQQWKFAKSSDYEDLVLLDSIFYVMKSKGDILAFNFLTIDSIKAEEYDIPLQSKNEFEILYYDSTIKKLVLICKDCDADDDSKTSAWSFDPATKTFSEGHFVIETATIEQHKDSEKSRFKPSAAAIHPKTGELYILSSINKSLVIADRKGKVKKTYPLNPKIYKQPEGIAFTPSGDLFISNEAAGEGLPNLLYFKYKNAVNEK